jgi:hypothetical protein
MCGVECDHDTLSRKSGYFFDVRGFHTIYRNEDQASKPGIFTSLHMAFPA